MSDFINETYYYHWKEYPAQHIITFIFSVIVSIYAIGGMVGALLTAPVARIWGSRGGLLWNNTLIFAGAALLGFSKMAQSYQMLVIGRFIVGMNSGKFLQIHFFMHNFHKKTT